MKTCEDCAGTGDQPCGYACCGGQGCSACTEGPARGYRPYRCSTCNGTGEVADLTPDEDPGNVAEPATATTQDPKE